MENQPIDKHAYERLHSEVAELLLKPDSLARTTEEIKPLFHEYQSLQARQDKLKSLEIKIAEMIPVIEQAEVEVAKAKRQLADEEKVLGTFAEELGRSVFAGFQAGVIPDQAFLSPRKELQTRLDELQANRSSLQSQQRTGLLEKTKQQAHLLALAGQIKFEEINVGSINRVLGEAILGYKGKLNIKCSYTEQVLKAIIEQQQHRVVPARGKLKTAEVVTAQRNAECGAKLGRASVQSSGLKAELKELRGEAVRNTKQMNGLREQVVDVAIKSEVAMLDATISLKLKELRKLQESQATNKFQFANRLGSVKDILKKLPAGKRRTALIAGGIILGVLLLIFLGRGMFSNGKGVQTAETVVDGRQSSKQGENTSGNPQPKEFANSIGMKLRLIPKGTFTMGSPASEKGRSDHERPHEVTISRGFYMGVYEVTQEEYQKVMGTNPSGFQDGKDGRFKKLDTSKHPVEEVTWTDANEFCSRLSELPEEKKAGRVYRLPTESEWEYACRSGSQAAYEFGDNEGSLRDAAWFGNNSGKNELDTDDLKEKREDIRGYTLALMVNYCRTHIVGMKRPNAWGLYDMHGNVREWCLDGFTFYPYDAVTDPIGSEKNEGRVARGGSYFDQAHKCRSAHRESPPPTARIDLIGFRVALIPGSLDSATTENPSVSKQSAPQEQSENRTSNTSTFRYMFNGKSYTGAIEQDDGSELVFYDPKDTLLSLTINKSTSTVVSSFLGVTKGRLHLGGGKENILLQLSFFLEGQPSKGPTRMLPTSRDELGDNSAKVRGSLVANYLRPGPSYKTHWFGKPASNVPKEDQEIVLRKGSSVLVGFGVPFKIQAETEVVRVQYAEFSPSGQLAMLKKFIGDPGLQFVIGDRTLQIDDSARRTLFLLERAVAVLRYRQGARDATSRPSMGD